MMYFKVQIEETAVYTLTVRASNKEEAGRKAEDYFINNIEVGKGITTEVPERDVVSVMKVKKPAVVAA